jgi:hypothetical protein
MGFNHAGLLLPIPFSPIPPSLHHLPGWKLDLDLKDKWRKRFSSLPLPSITDQMSLTHATCNLLNCISDVSDSLFPQKSPPTDRDLPWWSQECSLACAALKSCHWQDHHHHSMVLCMTIHNAKREWVDSLANNPDISIWDMAKWHKGRCLKDIPPILTMEGLSHDLDLMSTTFLSRFFHFRQDYEEPLTPLRSRSLPIHPLLDVRDNKVCDALRDTSNSLAPSPSGIGYLLLKWAFEATPSFFMLIFTHALCLGKHPWGEALVVIIPKPGKSDYTPAKAYCPISLLECCGKLLKKVVASCFSWEVNHLSLIGNHQFGSCHHYSAPDGALCLQYKAKETIHHGRIDAVLLFNISCFFDHLDPTLTTMTLCDLGVDEGTTNWVHSFMSNRLAWLSFNNHLSQPFQPTLGTPQGSPLSPILSAITTSPLLQESLDFNAADLTLYVDDSRIYTSGPTFISTLDKLVCSFETILCLLCLMGLKVDSEKTKVMFFHPHITPHHGKCPDTVTIAISNGKTLTVKPSSSIHYLGVFFTPKLD